MKFRNGVVAAVLLAVSGPVCAQGWFQNDDRGGGGWEYRENHNDNGEASDNQLREILRNETDINRRRAAWEASRDVRGQRQAHKILDP